MPIDAYCRCGQKFRAKDSLAGKRLKCPKCGEPLAIPALPLKTEDDIPVDDLTLYEESPPAAFAMPAGPFSTPMGGSPLQTPQGWPVAMGYGYATAPEKPVQRRNRTVIIAVAAGGGLLLLAVVVLVALAGLVRSRMGRQIPGAQEVRAFPGQLARFSPNGRLLLVSHEKDFIVYDVEAGTEQLRFAGKAEATSPRTGQTTASVQDIAFALNGELFVAGVRNLQVCDVKLGQQAWIVPGALDSESVSLLSNINSGYACVALSADARQVIALGGTFDMELAWWDVQNGKQISTRKTGIDSFEAKAAFSADGRRLLIGTREGELHLWDVESGKEVRRWKNRVPMTWAVAISADGRLGLSSHGGHKSGLGIDVPWETGKEFALAYAPKVVLWDLETGTEIRTCEFGAAKTFTARLAFSPSGQHVLSAQNDRIQLWDVATGRELAQCQHLGAEGIFESLSLSPDGRYIVSAAGGMVRLWNVPKE